MSDKSSGSARTLTAAVGMLSGRIARALFLLVSNMLTSEVVSLIIRTFPTVSPGIL